MVVGRPVDGETERIAFGYNGERQQQRRDAPPRRDAPRYPADAIGLARNRCPATRRLETTPRCPTCAINGALLYSHALSSPSSLPPPSTLRGDQCLSPSHPSGYVCRLRLFPSVFRFLGGAAFSRSIYSFFCMLSFLLFRYISEIILFFQWNFSFSFPRLLASFDPFKFRILSYYPVLFHYCFPFVSDSFRLIIL